MSQCAKPRKVGYKEIALSCDRWCLDLRSFHWTSSHRGSSKNGAGHMCWRTGRPDLGFLAHSVVVCACDCGKSHTCCSPCPSASSAALSLLASSSTALPSCFSTSFSRAGRPRTCAAVRTGKLPSALYARADTCLPEPPRLARWCRKECGVSDSPAFLWAVFRRGSAWPVRSSVSGNDGAVPSMQL